MLNGALDIMLYAAVAIVVALPIWWAVWIYRIHQMDKAWEQGQRERDA